MARYAEHNHDHWSPARFRSLNFGEAQRVPQGCRTHRCSAEEHGAPDLLMQLRQLLDSDAAHRSMAAMAGGCLIKLYELANLSSCKGETSHRRNPERLPLRQGSPGEDSPEGVHVWLHHNENLTDGDEAGDVLYPLVRHLLLQKQPLLDKGGQHHLLWWKQPLLDEGSQHYLIYAGRPPARHCAPKS